VNHNARATLLHRCWHLNKKCNYPVKIIADFLDVSQNAVERAITDVEMCGLPKPPRNLDLLVYPCECGQGFMQKADDVGVSNVGIESW